MRIAKTVLKGSQPSYPGTEDGKAMPAFAETTKGIDSCLTAALNPTLSD